jgi:hypothetical protein
MELERCIILHIRLKAGRVRDRDRRPIGGVFAAKVIHLDSKGPDGVVSAAAGKIDDHVRPGQPTAEPIQARVSMPLPASFACIPA